MQLRSQKTSAGTLAPLQERDRALSPDTPAKAQASTRRKLSADLLHSLPEEVLVQIICNLTEIRDLCALACVSNNLQILIEGCSDHWEGLFQRGFCLGAPTPVQRRAAELATSWQQLFKSRFVAQAEVAPWEKPSPFEVQAAIEQMILGPSIFAKNNPQFLPKSSSASPPSEACIVFLVDGSGSVTEDDFACMTDFMRNAAEQVAAITSTGTSTIRLAVIQFSTEVRVELPPTAIQSTIEQFVPAIESMQRMNGGTNIASAVQKAGQLLKGFSPECNRVIALLTDGRIDSFQAREAKEMTARLSDEQGSTSLHAFGVGRGVDRHELLHIVEGACKKEDPGNFYMPLLVLDDAPW